MVANLRERLVMALLLVGAGCTGASSEEDSAATSSVECSDSWVSEGQVVIEPDSCLRWSPRSEDEMDWYAAVDPEDAAAGGCTAHCDEDDVGWCDEVEGLEGLSGWRLPDIGELEDTAIRSPPFDDLEGYLWSRTSDDYMEQTAWTVDLSEPGSSMARDKNSDGYVRCVWDGA